MSKFFEYDEDTPQWFYIKARCMDIFKPDGKVIQFYLWGNSELHIRELIKKGNNEYEDIEWIKPIGDELPFV
jgi:hypothetical protein